jgi:uncharacterized protein with FMN-binding domain
MKRWVVALIAAGAIVAALALAAGVFVSKFRTMAREIGSMTFESIDITKVRDGSYKGDCSLFPVTATVRVNVEGGRIASIEVIKHMHGKGYGAEALAQRVVEAQSLDVDAVSGASGSSKAMRKAIENALLKGL